MDLEDSSMALMPMETWDDLVHGIAPTNEFSEFYNMTSDEFFRCMEEDYVADSVENPEISLATAFYNYDDYKEIWDSPPSPTSDDFLNIKALDSGSDTRIGFNHKAIPSYDSFFNLPEELKTCIDPRILQPTLSVHTAPEEEIKPYHPTQDHDYMKVESEDSDAVEVKEEIDEDEPVVDVWKIENFSDPPVSAPSPVQEQLPTYKRILRERTRTTSKRTAETKRRDQARKISHAVHAVLNIKPVNGRQYKNKPKNSVETTPSQSDIEEWQSHSVRPMYTKITKKKTSKGRIDHSQSERNRREILRKKFSELRKKIPIDFLRGEKASAQISKQKILNGAKGYIAEIYKSQSSYSTMQQQNKLLQELWLKKHISKLSKTVKRQK